MNSEKQTGATNHLSISGNGEEWTRTKLAVAIPRNLLARVVVAAILVIAAKPGACQTETVLYSFTGGSDGNYPASRLTFDVAGNLYGTTRSGGLGFGTVFELSPKGHGGWNETVLYSFSGGSDGSNPTYSPVIFDSMGNLYGSTSMGGAKRQGVVFQLTPAEGGWKETVLHSFLGSKKDGGSPAGALVMDGAGNIYGTASRGAGTKGAVFELSPAGGGAWTERILYGVAASFGGLAMDAAGDLFFTSRDNSSDDHSSVFELSPNGEGGWSANFLYAFAGTPDGADAQGTIAFDGAGNLYGTTYLGGAYNGGTVYRLSPEKDGWKEEILYSFPRMSKDIPHPFGGVVLDAAGNIYGTTVGQGVVHPGSVFELVPSGGGSYSFKGLWNFGGASGRFPYSSVILDGTGNLYGTTTQGGAHDAGVVFELTP
jgi:uncharacterized repeat protein (TIGR03803 family)